MFIIQQCKHLHRHICLKSFPLHCKSDRASKWVLVGFFDMEDSRSSKLSVNTQTWKERCCCYWGLFSLISQQLMYYMTAARRWHKARQLEWGRENQILLEVSKERATAPFPASATEKCGRWHGQHQWAPQPSSVPLLCTSGGSHSFRFKKHKLEDPVSCSFV